MEHYHVAVVTEEHGQTRGRELIATTHTPEDMAAAAIERQQDLIDQGGIWAGEWRESRGRMLQLVVDHGLDPHVRFRMTGWNCGAEECAP